MSAFFAGRQYGYMKATLEATIDCQRHEIRFENGQELPQRAGAFPSGSGKIDSYGNLDLHIQFVAFNALYIIDAPLARVSGDWEDYVQSSSGDGSYEEGHQHDLLKLPPS